jgi:signal transduction histidine kinase/ligand-binding sensor domain-containing protein
VICAIRGLGVVTALGCSATACAAEVPFWQPSLLHTAWTQRDGAPANPSAMVQDDTGMLWIGASDGLFRFDGVRFERVEDIAGNKLISPNVYALSLIDNALWVGYVHGGVSVFKHGSVRHYGEAEGIPPSAIAQFGKTSDGMHWLASAAGIYWLDGARWRHVTPDDGLPPGDMPNLNVLNDGGLLVTHFTGLYRNTPGTHRFHKVADFGSMQRSQMSADGKVITFKFGETPQLFDPVAQNLTALRLPQLDAPPYSVHRDRRNGWWIGHGDGMRLYTPDMQLQQQFLAPHDFSSQRVFRAPLDDREGNLWFMTENGLDRIRESRLSVQDMPAFSTDFSIIAGPEGEVWISAHSSRDPISPPTFAVAADGHRIASDMYSATAATLAADGTLWFGDPHWLWSRRDGKVTRWPLTAALQRRPMQALAMDDDGRLWVSVARCGVHTFKDGVWQAGGGHAALAARSAVALHADSQGRVWFGYTGNAMAMLHDNKVKHFGPADGLAVGNVLSMFSRRGTLWVGGDQGLARFQEGRFISLNDSAGHPIAGIAGIVQTAQGELWLQVVGGLIRIAAADLAGALKGGLDRVAIERFDHLDGYKGATQQVRPLNSLVETNDGRLWYATSNSVGWIDPRRIARNTLAPTPQVTAIAADSKRYRPVNGLALPEHTHNLQIDFTAAVLSIPERARFRSRLIGQDHAWHDVGTRRQAFYTNLGPGDYRFEVMAANEDGIWSLAPASLSFRIAPAFYQTLWFRLACAALLAGALYLLHRWRLADMTARMVERMRERIDERERIARTLHDTFLQSVQGLILRFHSIRAVLPKEDMVRREIDAALDLADAVNVEGREQLMDLRSTRSGEADLAKVLERVGAATCAHYGVVFSLHERGTRRALHRSVQDELLAIAKEALFNALRHSGSDTVEMHLTCGATSFTLEVRDHGKGFEDDVQKYGGQERHWGLTGMRERAAHIGAELSIHSASGEGTVVCVTLGAGIAYR